MGHGGGERGGSGGWLDLGEVDMVSVCVSGICMHVHVRAHACVRV